MDLIAAKNHITETCGTGWLNLIDIVFDNKPSNITITEVFQKWGGLKICFDGEDEIFDELVNNIYYISTKMCEICGKSAFESVMDGWETALCDHHYQESNAKQKYRNRK